MICKTQCWILHQQMNFGLVNIFYKKQVEHLIIFMSKNSRTQNNYFTVRRKV